ncbi:Bacterial ABC transporter protein EcsB [compost metagenome]
MLVILGPLTVYSGFRTYIQPADVVFLLPQENKMKEYFSSIFRSGVIYKLIGLYIVTIILYPLYMHIGTEYHPLWLILIVLCLLKVLSAYGAWQELRITTNRARAGYRLLRWCSIILMLAAWLWQPAWKSALFMALVSINYLLALRFPMKHAVPWDNLIENEKSGAAKVMLILGWFVEVPAEGQKVIRRRWLSAVGNHIAWNRQTSYRYLLMKTFVRSEWLGIIIRLTLLGMVLVGWNGGTWLGGGAYLLFIFLSGTQLTSLRYVHSDSPAASYYPISSGTRKQEIVRLASTLLLSLTILLWVPMIAASDRNWPIIIGSLILGILLALGMRSSWSKKWLKDEDD